jgi:hypothetical protein
MTKKSLFRISMMALITGTLNFAQAETVYVQTDKAPLKSDASMSSTTLTEMKRGDSLEQIERKGLWLQVKAGAKTGWVSKLAVAASKPVSQVTVLSSLKKPTEEQAARSRSRPVEAASARGLSANDVLARKSGNQALYNLDRSSVDALKASNVDPAELDKFLRSANLSH